MPLTTKGRKILQHMQKQYGVKKGRAVFYASLNKGRVMGVERGRKPSARKGPTHDV